MHWSGKFAIFLCLLAWIATVPLVAKLMQIRNEYTKQVTQLTTSNDDKAKQIGDLEQKRTELLDALDVTTRKWGMVWDDRDLVQFNRGSGAATVGVGLDDFLGDPDPSKRPIWLHAFRPQEPRDVKKVGLTVSFHAEDAVGGAAPGDEGYLSGPVVNVEEAANQLLVDVFDDVGNAKQFTVPVDAVLGYEYLGKFEVTRPGDRDSEIQPNWLTRADDIAMIEPVAPGLKSEFRFREKIPVPISALMGDLYNQLTYEDEFTNDRERFKAIAQANLDRHNAHLQEQMDALVGTPGDPGLQGRLAAAEQARNEALERLDRLRRQIDVAYEDQQALVAAVNELSGELPGAGE